ncbi:MAG: glycosyltransferase family 4 protein [Planctomycetota bacterium]
MSDPAAATGSPAGPPRRVFINGMSIGTGGGYTVGRELARYLAIARPDWEFTFGLIRDHRLQSEMESESLPDNVTLFWAPARTADPRQRMRYEAGELTEGINRERYDAVVQLNGMILSGVQAPTLAHFQDPFPYRPEAWTTLKQRVSAWMKRRENRRALKQAAVCGWTSHYLEELVCGHHRVRPERSIVFYNGVPDAWIDRARQEPPAWGTRPMKLVTVSNVWPYKRQSLVVEALAMLRKRSGLESLEYHVIGGGEQADLDDVQRLAERLGVGDAVHVEGRVPDSRVEEAMATSRAMPLMSVCESFGIPTIEAMAYGTPVVVADCCALPEVCGEAAIVSPVDDPRALADNLERLLSDSALVDRLRQLGQERVLRFQWKAIGQQMADAVASFMPS